MSLIWVQAQWPAAVRVRAVTSTRHGGLSQGPYAALNLAEHVGDDARTVQANRDLIRRDLQLPCEPLWLRQAHGTRVVDAAQSCSHAEADGSYARDTASVCAVLTADCLPVFLCDHAATRVAVLHAGWRGLAAGIIENGVRALDCEASEILAYLGPAIGPQAFEVGDEVRRAFVTQDDRAQQAFRPSHADPTHSHSGEHWLADLYVLARQQLQAMGVNRVFGGGFCTYSDESRFYSYRRQSQTGRMASLIWLAAE